MEELSIEQKAQRYDEAIEKLCNFYRDYDTVSCLIDVKEELANLFPELKESEDEKIRKKLISSFKGIMADADEDELWYGLPYNDIIAWLEKQCEKGTNGNEREIPNSEQKPIDKVEPFDKYEGLTDFERTLADICIGWIGEELGWKQYIKDNADVLLKIAIKKFNSAQDVAFEQKPAELSQSEVTKTSDQVQKPAEWSDEDELHIRGLESLVRQEWAIAERENDKDKIYKMRDLSFFLKTLKPQLKKELSEEDENMLENTIGLIEVLDRETKGAFITKEYIDFLKSLKERYTWRPSDNELEVLRLAAEKDGACLMGLYEQLKKLKS